MERQISGMRGPVYSSRMVNRVEPSVPGARVKVRTPLNRPSGMPPLQVITDALPNRISRPAVSRHLRLLKEARLMTDRAEGTRRLYRLDDAGIAAVREYLEHVWGEAAARFRLLAENTGEQTERGDR
jgi:DNA-binding transcriptional ArsR family regulator